MSRQPSVMAHQFSMVPKAEIPRSSFDRSHGHKTTLDVAGVLYPIFVDEALPGDTFNLNMTGFCRMSTPLHPIMDNSYFNTFFFAVPIRLLWDNWQKFNGEQRNPGDSTDFLVPQNVGPGAPGWQPHSMPDYFGLPLGVPNLSVSALPFRAYNLIWNEWFRDENLQASVPNPVDDGPDQSGWYQLAYRGKRHDYFTSALPWPQKGQSVSLPLGQYAPVVPIGQTYGTSFPQFSTKNQSPEIARSLAVAPDGHIKLNSGQTVTADNPLYWGADTGLFANLSTASAATINQLRQAFQVQRLYERDARGGTRYIEILRSHFGVISPDARLQRPEYLGGGQSPVTISQVPQTSATGQDGSTTPLGNLAAFGTSVLSGGHGFTKSFTEHCIIIGLVSVRADLTYQRGLNRMWSRRQRFDFYWPALSHIGEQTVLSKELWMDGTTDDETVFGYQERYAEYRYKPSMITGVMRSTDAASLDTWHLSQDFQTRPLLNGAFIAEQPPFERVVAVPSEPIFIADFYFKLRCARPMPVYGVPGMMDHF